MKRSRKVVNGLLVEDPGMEFRRLYVESNRRMKWGITSRELAQILRSIGRRKR